MSCSLQLFLRVTNVYVSKITALIQHTISLLHLSPGMLPWNLWNISLHLLDDIDMLHNFKAGIRGCITFTKVHHVKANNLLMETTMTHLSHNVLWCLQIEIFEVLRLHIFEWSSPVNIWHHKGGSWRNKRIFTCCQHRISSLHTWQNGRSSINARADYHGGGNAHVSHEGLVSI